MARQSVLCARREPTRKCRARLNAMTAPSASSKIRVAKLTALHVLKANQPAKVARLSVFPVRRASFKMPLENVSSAQRVLIKALTVRPMCASIAKAVHTRPIRARRIALHAKTGSTKPKPGRVPVTTALLVSIKTYRARRAACRAPVVPTLARRARQSVPSVRKEPIKIKMGKARAKAVSLVCSKIRVDKVAAHCARLER